MWFEGINEEILRQELTSTTFAVKVALISNTLAIVRDAIAIWAFLLIVNNAISRFENKVEQSQAELNATVTRIEMKVDNVIGGTEKKIDDKLKIFGRK